MCGFMRKGGILSKLKFLNKYFLQFLLVRTFGVKKCLLKYHKKNFIKVKNLSQKLIIYAKVFLKAMKNHQPCSQSYWGEK